MRREEWIWILAVGAVAGGLYWFTKSKKKQAVAEFSGAEWPEWLKVVQEEKKKRGWPSWHREMKEAVRAERPEWLREAEYYHKGEWTEFYWPSWLRRLDLERMPEWLKTRWKQVAWLAEAEYPEARERLRKYSSLRPWTYTPERDYYRGQYVPYGSERLSLQLPKARGGRMIVESTPITTKTWSPWPPEWWREERRKMIRYYYRARPEGGFEVLPLGYGEYGAIIPTRKGRILAETGYPTILEEFGLTYYQW